jgi:N utilization substance protein B
MPSRHRSRERALQMLYQWDLTKASAEQVIEAYWGGLSSADLQRDVTDDPFANELLRGVVRHIGRIDELIVSHASNWRIDRMSTVDRSILRMAVYEMLEDASIAPVAINEALEIGRRFSGQDSVSFLNGVLDAIRKSLEQSSAAPVNR